MRIISSLHHGAAANAPSSLARLVTVALDTLYAWQERARQRRDLAGISDHTLKDIGLSRAQVFDEYRKPFWRG